jgi:hypothetical protein
VGYNEREANEPRSGLLGSDSEAENPCNGRLNRIILMRMSDKAVLAAHILDLAKSLTFKERKALALRLKKPTPEELSAVRRKAARAMWEAQRRDGIAA